MSSPFPPASPAEPAAEAAVAATVPANTPAATEPATPAPSQVPSPVPSRGTLAFGALAVLSLVISALVWERLGSVQDQVARQVAEAGASASEARNLVRLSQDQERELAARQAMLEARVAELTQQRAQLDELMQSLSRSRDENLVADIESSLRLAQQQAQLTGGVAPLLAALSTAQQRIQRASQARLAPVLRAIDRDTTRIKSTPLVDLPTLLERIDELVRELDELPLANAVGPAPAPTHPAASAGARPVAALHGWQQVWAQVLDEGRRLVRVSRVDEPDAVLLAPDQSFFVRENTKLLLLNARLGLLARQPEGARADLAKAAQALSRYFDGNSLRTRTALALLQQTRDQSRVLQLPRVDDTLAALGVAGAGR